MLTYLQSITVRKPIIPNPRYKLRNVTAHECQIFSGFHCMQNDHTGLNAVLHQVAFLKICYYSKIFFPPTRQLCLVGEKVTLYSNFIICVHVAGLHAVYVENCWIGSQECQNQTLLQVVWLPHEFFEILHYLFQIVLGCGHITY